jgi:hypothetical protein
VKKIPEKWKYRPARLDHSRFYVTTMFALLLSCISLLMIGPTPNSSISSLDKATQLSLATVLFIGITTCCIGIVSGTRIFRRHADIRDCCMLSVYATPSNVVALGTYIAAIGNTYHWSLWSFNIGAACAMGVLCGHVLMACDRHWEIKRIDERVKKTIDAVAAAKGTEEDDGEDDN